MNLLREHVQISFTLTFIAFCATAFYLYLEKDRVPPQFKTASRVSIVYMTIAAVNYYYMKNIYEAGLLAGASQFPTQFRYIDWILTTPLMLVKFPLLLGVGEKGIRFMTRLVVLDLAMIIFGYVGEITSSQAVHWGAFMAGCVAWVLIAVQLFLALVDLPENITEATKRGVRLMGVLVVAGWAIYPLGFFAPLLGAAPDVRECLLVYATAKRSQVEMDAQSQAYAEEVPMEQPMEESQAAQVYLPQS
jgi:sensory rhodopsin